MNAKMTRQTLVAVALAGLATAGMSAARAETIPKGTCEKMGGTVGAD